MHSTKTKLTIPTSSVIVHLLHVYLDEGLVANGPMMVGVNGRRRPSNRL